MEPIFFDGWKGVMRTALLGVCAYAALVILLRLSGKRTLAKMNAFDLVVTVALGSSLATILLSKDTTLAEGITALITLILLQAVVAFVSTRSRKVEEVVKSEPVLLMHRGLMLADALRNERVTELEIWAAIRSEGIAHAGQVEAVILETDGSFSVLKSHQGQPADTLHGVREKLAHQ
jgi:uncharacterized membrane protein YcaP (DUF421 family)